VRREHLVETGRRIRQACCTKRSRY
jgi:hypothetical protein